MIVWSLCTKLTLQSGHEAAELAAGGVPSPVARCQPRDSYTATPRYWHRGCKLEQRGRSHRIAVFADPQTSYPHVSMVIASGHPRKSKYIRV